jgi:CRISPR-associated protein Cas2
MCQNYGQRVQLSVFECIVDPGQWTIFRQKLIDIIDQKQDSLRFYFLGANWRGRIEHLGSKVAIDQEGPLII